MVNWDALIATAQEGKAADAAAAAENPLVGQLLLKFQTLDAAWNDVLSRVGPWENVSGPLRDILQPTKNTRDAAQADYQAEMAKSTTIQYTAQYKVRQCLAILQPWLAVSLLQS